MSLASMLADTVEVLDFTETSTDDFGNPTGSWTVTQTRKARVSNQRGLGTEERAGQEVAFARKLLFLDPTDGAVTDRQRIRWDSRDWFIVEVFPVFGRAATHHLRLTIEEAH